MLVSTCLFINLSCLIKFRTAVIIVGIREEIIIFRYIFSIMYDVFLLAFDEILIVSEALKCGLINLYLNKNSSVSYPYFYILINLALKYRSKYYFLCSV